MTSVLVDVEDISVNRAALQSHTQRSRDRADTLASLFLPFENLVQQTPMLFSYWLGGWLVLNDGLAAGDLANFLETTRQLIKELRSRFGPNFVVLDRAISRMLVSSSTVRFGLFSVIATQWSWYDSTVRGHDTLPWFLDTSCASLSSISP